MQFEEFEEMVQGRKMVDSLADFSRMETGDTIKLSYNLESLDLFQLSKDRALDVSVKYVQSIYQDPFFLDVLFENETPIAARIRKRHCYWVAEDVFQKLLKKGSQKWGKQEILKVISLLVKNAELVDFFSKIEAEVRFKVFSDAPKEFHRSWGPIGPQSHWQFESRGAEERIEMDNVCIRLGYSLRAYFAGTTGDHERTVTILVSTSRKS